MSTLYTALTQRMNHLIARQGVIAGNIANADTPGYLAQDLQPAGASGHGGPFAMLVTRAGHLSASKGKGSPAGRLVEDTTFIEHNGNSVRLDAEMLKMNEIQMNYQMLTQLYSKQVQLQKLAIGRGQ